MRLKQLYEPKANVSRKNRYKKYKVAPASYKSGYSSTCRGYNLSYPFIGSFIGEAYFKSLSLLVSGSLPPEISHRHSSPRIITAACWQVRRIAHHGSTQLTRTLHSQLHRKPPSPLSLELYTHPIVGDCMPRRCENSPSWKMPMTHWSGSGTSIPKHHSRTMRLAHHSLNIACADSIHAGACSTTFPTTLCSAPPSSSWHHEPAAIAAFSMQLQQNHLLFHTNCSSSEWIGMPKSWEIRWRSLSCAKINHTPKFDIDTVPKIAIFQVAISKPLFLEMLNFNRKCG